MAEPGTDTEGVVVRPAVDADAAEIRDLFITVYGADYPYVEFYDEEPLKKVIYSDDTVMLVARQGRDGPLLGSASVMLDFGAHSDLVGEFGRLVVTPEARHRGIGGVLMRRRIESVKDRLHVGLVEARVTHPYSQQNAESSGFAPIGFLPLKLQFTTRESAALLVRYFGDALALRRNNPRIIPEVYPVASLALANLSLPVDVIVDEHSPAYPGGGTYDLDDLTTRGYASLLRVERGRVSRREVLGPMRLHYGFFRLRARHSSYLIARDNGRVVGAVGFTRDEVEKGIRVFELITLQDDAIRFLLTALSARCRDELQAAYIEIDVNGHAPRMQRTLLELGFTPVAYVPALAFHEVERVDVVKMARVLVDPSEERPALTPEMSVVHRLVMRGLEKRQLAPDAREVLAGAALLRGLIDEQVDRVAADGRLLEFNPKERLFAEGDAATELFVVLSGDVDVRMGHPNRLVGTVSAGESLGEMALVLGGRHSATAVATTCGTALVLSRERLRELLRVRPDIGVTFYHNLATGMAEKLKSADLALLRTD
jgi:GNAT superfamily N-acetyltransferase